MRWATSLAILAAVAATGAQALLTRADREDAEYVELATRYTAALALPGGEGTLIAPRWILTAASVARAIEPNARLAIAGKPREIQAVHVQADLALLQLREPIEGNEATSIYREADEDGKVVRIVGHGVTGTIGAKAIRDNRERTKRAGINTIDRVSGRTLALRIKGAEDASDLQGAATAGEAGAPAFVETKDGIFVAGVLVLLDGEWEIYARISARSEWIDATIREVAAKEAAAVTGDAERR